jgi:hypothetical protein
MVVDALDDLFLDLESGVLVRKLGAAPIAYTAGWDIIRKTPHGDVMLYTYPVSQDVLDKYAQR